MAKKKQAQSASKPKQTKSPKRLKSPSQPTIKRLFTLAGNRCAFPNCPTPLVHLPTGEIVGEVCHIKGDKPRAARYDKDQDDRARHGIDNLVIMCNCHHKVIDGSPDVYTVEVLTSMKLDHENRKDGKETVSKSISDAFVNAAEAYFETHIVQATNLSNSQIAHTIINNPPPGSEVVKVEGSLTSVTSPEQAGCPYLTLTVVCRSRRPAKIRRAKISLLDRGIMASLEAAFGQRFPHTPLPDSDEELRFELPPMQAPNSPNGFVLQQDDIARFGLPILFQAVGFFLMRPASAMSLKVKFFDGSEQVVVDGDTLKSHLENLFEVAKQVPCSRRYHLPMSVNVKSLTPPGVGPVGQTNPNPLTFGFRIDDPNPPSSQNNSPPPVESIPWFERRGTAIAYPEVLQGRAPHCVYAAIAGAVNHLMQREVWTAEKLFGEHQKNWPKAADWDVASTALQPVSVSVEQFHHHRDHSSRPLTPALIREWVEQGAIVILSRELRQADESQPSRWHMFTIVACDGDLFQVWDTSGLKGFLTEEEIQNGFAWPNGLFFGPHSQEDTLVLKRKQPAKAE